MTKKTFIDKEIEEFYHQTSEEKRLELGLGQLEFERTKEIVEKYLPNPGSTIIDIGGGTGKYSAWLSEKLHKVVMVEPIEKHIKLAQKRSNQLKNGFRIIRGEASSIELQDNYADLILFHGPLYHLQKSEDRNKALAEATRLLKPGGILLGVAINYAASTVVGLLQGLIHNKSFFDMCKTELTNGNHHPAEDFPWLLPKGYYHKPGQLKKEILDQDLKFINIYAIEGMAWLDKEYFISRSEEKRWKILKELLDITQNDPDLLSFSPHMMIVAKKNRN